MSKVISVEHPSYLLGKLQEQIFMLRRYAEDRRTANFLEFSETGGWVDDILDHANSMMDTALQLTVSVNEQEKAYRAELRKERTGEN